MEEVNRFRHDPSMEEERLKPVLDLADCLEAFSTKEILDGAQAWYETQSRDHPRVQLNNLPFPRFCPVCERNRRAIKTLSVWRYPDFLIVHLKRLVTLSC